MSQASVISPARFRSIFGTFPAGVSVVTTSDLDGRPFGLTATSVCSVSLEPPLLLVCVADDSTTLPALRLSKRFVVNFLAGGRVGLARRYASDLEDKFAGVRWLPSAEGVRILSDDSVSYAECRTVDERRAGDHLIVIGLVERGEVLAEAPPLMFRGGVFKSWPDDEATAAEADALALAWHDL